MLGAASSSSGDNNMVDLKKIRIRGGHRAYVSKLMNDVVDVLKEDSIESHKNQLKTWKLTLSEKLQDLKKLDSEVVDLAEAEEEINKEICESSDYASKVQACITDINSTLHLHTFRDHMREQVT